MFRTLCRRALKGDNRALAVSQQPMLTFEPAARHKAKEAKEKDATVREAARKFDRSMRGDPDKSMTPGTSLNPKMDELTSGSTPWRGMSAGA